MKMLIIGEVDVEYMETVLSLQLYYTYKTTLKIKKFIKMRKTSPELTSLTRPVPDIKSTTVDFTHCWLMRKQDYGNFSRWLFSCHCTSQVAFPVFCCSFSSKLRRRTHIAYLRAGRS